MSQERRQRANRAGTRTASESNLAAGGAEPSAASEIARLEAVGTAAELVRVQGEISELRGELFGHEAHGAGGGGGAPSGPVELGV